MQRACSIAIIWWNLDSQTGIRTFEDYPNLDFFGIKCYRVVIKWREEERVMEKEEVARVDGSREFRGFKI